MTITLGINSVYHESSAAIMRNGKLIAAIEEERFNRIKHGKSATIESAAKLPYASIDWCLAQAGVRISEVDAIGLSFEPEKRVEAISLVKEETIPGEWGHPDGEMRFVENVKSIPEVLCQHYGRDLEKKIHWVNHHICHLASAFYPSPFQEAAVLSVDGIGQHETLSLAHGKDRQLKILDQVMYPHSIGFLWEKFCKYLALTDYDACKVMSLATFGDPNVFRSQFDKFVTTTQDGQFQLNNDILKFRSEDYSPMEDLFKVTRRTGKEEGYGQEYLDMCATLQSITSSLLVSMGRRLKEETGSKYLCMAGGVALNCVANHELIVDGLFEDIFVQPAAHDAGTAIGAAARLSAKYDDHQTSWTMDHAFTGTSFTDAEIRDALDKRGLKYEKQANIGKPVAKMISKGNIVAWFQGACEFGPRALGHRSILADPRNPVSRKRIDTGIKFRDSYRPYAPSMLADKMDEWFKVENAVHATRFMCIVYYIQDDKKDVVPSILHIDGSSRVHAVHRDMDARYYDMISEFEKETGVPILLNTSLNSKAPIVQSPDEAIELFLRTDIDALAISDYLVVKNEQTV